MFLQKLLLFSYQLSTFVFSLFLSIFIKGFIFEPASLRQQNILVTLENARQYIDVEHVYIATSIADTNAAKTLPEIYKNLNDHQSSHSKLAKPDIATLASCGILLQNHVCSLYAKRASLLKAADQSAKLVRGFYVILNTKEQCESIIEACNSSGRIDVQDVFVHAATAKGKVTSFTSYEFDLPFAKWHKELSSLACKIPVKSCSPIFYLPKPKGKFLLFCISERFEHTYYKGSSEIQKIRNYYELCLHEEETRFKQGGILTYLEPEQGKGIFATAILVNGKKVFFTAQDFEKFRLFFCDKFERSPEQWALFFKRAILQWFICYSLGLLDSIDMQYIYNRSHFYQLAKNILEKNQKQHGGILFKVDRFTFNSDKVVSKVINYLNSLNQSNISALEIAEELERATKYSGIRIAKDITINLDTVIDIHNNTSKSKDAILPGDFVFRCEKYTPAESAIKQDGDCKDEFNIYHIKQLVNCPEIRGCKK